MTIDEHEARVREILSDPDPFDYVGAVDYLLTDFWELAAEAQRLRSLLSDAADDIEEWGGYASEYFQEKHDLAGTVEKYRNASEAARDRKNR